MRTVDSNTLCIECGKPALQRSATDAAKREVGITGICGVCWDNIHGVDSEEEDEDDEDE